MGMIGADIGQHGRHTVEGTGLIVTPTYARLNRCPFDLVLLKECQCNQNRHLVEAVDMISIF